MSNPAPIALTLPRLPPGHDDHVRDLPVELLDDLDRERLLPFDAAGCSSSWRGRRPLPRRAAGRSPCSRRSRCRAPARARRSPAAARAARAVTQAARQDDDGRNAGRGGIGGQGRRRVAGRRAGDARMSAPSAIICLTTETSTVMPEVLEGPGVRVAAQLDPQVVEPELAAVALGPEQVRAALVHRDDVLVCAARGRPIPSCPRRRSRTASSSACSGRRRGASRRRDSGRRSASRSCDDLQQARRTSGSGRSAARSSARRGSRRCSGRPRGRVMRSWR